MGFCVELVSNDCFLAKSKKLYVSQMRGFFELKMDYSLQRGQSEYKQIENVSGLKPHSLARFFDPMRLPI
jgi:hypothetical protein